LGREFVPEEYTHVPKTAIRYNVPPAKEVLNGIPDPKCMTVGVAGMWIENICHQFPLGITKKTIEGHGVFPVESGRSASSDSPE